MDLDPFYDELEESLKIEFSKLPNRGESLDVGCGKGWLTNLLFNDYNQCVLGIDKSKENIKACLSNANSCKLEYKNMDIEKSDSLTFENSFSFISCHNVLGYLSLPVEQLNKMYSWLQPDGVFSLITRSPSGRFAEVYERSKSYDLALKRYTEKSMKANFDERCELFKLNDLVKMIEEAGFSILAKHGLFSIEKYLPEGYKELKKGVPQSEMEEHFFQWIWCKKE